MQMTVFVSSSDPIHRVVQDARRAWAGDQSKFRYIQDGVTWTIDRQRGGVCTVLSSTTVPPALRRCQVTFVLIEDKVQNLGKEHLSDCLTILGTSIDDALARYEMALTRGFNQLRPL